MPTRMRGNQRNSKSSKTWGVSSAPQDVAEHYSSTGFKTCLLSPSVNSPIGKTSSLPSWNIKQYTTSRQQKKKCNDRSNTYIQIYSGE